jgi:hypothetical protein
MAVVRESIAATGTEVTVGGTDCSGDVEVSGGDTVVAAAAAVDGPDIEATDTRLSGCLLRRA